MSDESLMGFVLRMGNRNGLDGFYWLYKQLSRDKLNHLKKEDLPTISHFFGAKNPLLDLAFIEEKRQDGEYVGLAHGHQISRPYLLRHLRPQLCPYCISESGYARSLWDFSVVSACPRHYCKLIDECPQCCRKIRWNRPALTHCNCGFCWGLYRPQSIASNHPCAIVAKAIAEQLPGHEKQFDHLSEAHSRILHQLPLDVLMRIIWAFGIKESVNDQLKSGVSRTILRSSVAFNVNVRAIKRLSTCIPNYQRASEIRDEVHIPAILALIKEAGHSWDACLVGIFRILIGDRSRRAKTAFSDSNQLTLF